jgi:hypothetical protein
MKKAINRIIKLIVGFSFLFLLIFNIGIKDLFNIFLTVKINWLILAFLLLVIDMIFASLNYKILLKALKRKVSLRKLLRYISLSWSLGTISPGKLGEFGLVWLLKNKENINYGEGLIITILDKILTLIALLTFSSIGFYLFLDIDYFIILIILIIIAIISTFTILLNNKSRNLIKKYILKDYSKYFKGFSKSLKEIIINKKKHIILNLILTYVKWANIFLSIYFLFIAFNIKFDYILITIIFSFTTIISLIPISFSGLGVREVSGTYLLTLFNIPKEIGANVYLTITIETYILAFIYYVLNQNLLKAEKTKNKNK